MSDICRVMPGTVYDEATQLNFKDCMERLVHLEQILGQNTDTWNLREHAATQSWSGYYGDANHTADGEVSLITLTVTTDEPCDLIIDAQTRLFSANAGMARVILYVYRDGGQLSGIDTTTSGANERSVVSDHYRLNGVAAGTYTYELRLNMRGAYPFQTNYHRFTILALYR